MSITQGLQLPFGIQQVNPVPIDSWSGPYTGSILQDALDEANAAIPIEIRFLSMSVRLIVNGESKLFWYKDGIDDSDLIEFGLGPAGPTGGGGIGSTPSFYLQGTLDYSYGTTPSIYRTGNIAIGTSASSSSKLYIFSTQSGAFRLEDGTQADGYILRSDANGVASWTESSIYFNGSASTIPMFTGVSTLGNSLLSILNGRTLIIAGAGIGATRAALSPISYLSIQRAQTQIDVILGNSDTVDESQKSTIISDNINGLEIRSRTRLILSSDYLERLRIEDGNIGIGLTAPSTKLHIFATQSGAFRLEDGTQGNGYVLTSDSNGIATWATTDSINWFRDTTNTIYNTNTGGIFLFGSTSSAPDSLTGGGLIIQGSNANNTVYGGNNSNTAIITFMPSTNNVFPVDNAVSGIQSCDYNYGNVRAGIYFQSEVGNQGRPAIVFRVGGSGAGVGSLPEIMRISQLGNIGIGTTQSQMKLHIKGTQSTITGGGMVPGVFRLEDGTQGNDYILRSDANGVASWTASIKGLSFLGNSEVISNSINATASTVNYDYNTSSIFYHETASTNYTANFTNLPTTNNRVVSVSLFITQGVTPYIPNIVKISGVTQSIKWAGGSQSGTANSVDLVSFNFIRTNDDWTDVIGQIATFS